MPRRIKKRDSNLLEQLETEYRSIQPTAERFCTELSEQINTLLDSKQISLGLPIEYRVKQWSSIAYKLERLPLKISSVKDLNDLIGLRIILLFKRDLLKVCDLLKSTFDVLNQYDTQERLKEDQFGYSSVHFIVKLPEAWLAVPSLSQMGGLKAEIQVRTMAQHIWAAASHSLQYKQEASVPPPVRRAIYRVSALLETIDLEFERVLEQRDRYRSGIETVMPNDRLNVDLLEKMLDSLLPEINKDEDEPYSELLTDLLHFKIDTVLKLERLIKKNLSKALEDDMKRVAEIREEAKEPGFDADSYGDNTFERIEKGIFYTHVGLVRGVLKAEFKDKFETYLIDRY